ncbi:MAG: hypothetical protein H6Q52_2874 [Deltaproteobacteria bacterium]|nr:hypothetical protein [Deltaproteobacteria bacterium]
MDNSLLSFMNGVKNLVDPGLSDGRLNPPITAIPAVIGIRQYSCVIC